MSAFTLETIRHSCAHIMAAAVKRLFPDTRFDIGPSTDDGFYYDFDMEHRLGPEDLEAIEAEMQKIVSEKLPFNRMELSRADAQDILKKGNQNFKLERLADIPEGESISFYQCGDFVDLCRGPHVENSGQAGSFKLLSIAGSYYRGKETNPMLQRVYGTAFANDKELRKYLLLIEEAKKRDHRKLGKELELYTVAEDVGPGLIIWQPKGGRIRNQIENFWREEHYKNGYELLYTPHIGLAKLWQTSGHLDFYKDAMYSPMEIDKNNYYVKPMNCPFHIQAYQTKNRSYRELPLRWAELGTVYRYEKGGVLHGLLRVRGFTQDDAHIICTPEQIEDEIERVLKFSLYIWKCFGFKEVNAYLATRPEKAVGEESRWAQAIVSLEKAVNKCGLKCEVDKGGGAFYGPKIDLKVKDAIGREWQTTTIQFDFNLPERFDMNYIAADGQKHRPYMVHRALFGSLERFFGILIENCAGAFPLWLAPEQVRILPITEDQHEATLNLANKLKELGFRVDYDLRTEKIGAKIRDARNLRIPMIAVIGEKEVAAGTVSVRSRREGELGAISIDTLIEKMKIEVAEKL
ncbi:MAG TPA: threonine--tRNA ligase [Lentisphaeria bacterium]|nr:MAG: threonine--tRNA ligase [Lentisphaerae bacterium GWF2_50_93]HCE41919.1 threonine--tRNA ligase [Lentisphaeria bacterium]